MKKFEAVYYSIINEERFKSSKWKIDGVIEGIEVIENKLHLAERLKVRYDIKFEYWIEWKLIKKMIILNFIKYDLWSKCSKKVPYQKGFTVHLTVSNMWLSGVLQNDLDNKMKRIYFSTFLPEEPTHNPHDIKLDLPL